MIIWIFIVQLYYSSSWDNFFSMRTIFFPIWTSSISTWSFQVEVLIRVLLSSTKIAIARAGNRTRAARMKGDDPNRCTTNACWRVRVYINVSYVMEFLTWWVLKSKVFAQKSTVVKWNCCIFWIDIVWGLQKLGLLLESKVVQKLSLEKMFLTKNGLLKWYF